MENKKHKQEWTTSSRIGNQSAICVLLFIICFVSMLQVLNFHSYSILQSFSTQPAIGYRLPYSKIADIHSLRHGGSFCRAVHFAASSALDFAALQHSPTRKNELFSERLAASMLASSGLAVRAPPQFLPV